MRRSPIWLACVLALLGVGCAPEGPTAFVDGNVPWDSDCVASTESEVTIPIGIYDISEAGTSNDDPKSTPCKNSYFLNLRINSYLRPNADDELGRAETNILLVDSAEVKLMTLNKAELGFEGLPNPFRVVTAATVQPTTGVQASQGLASIEAIPSAYAEFLGDFVGSKILIETQIFGTTTGDVDIEMKPFVYAVDICDGCLTLCLDADIGTSIPLEDVIGDECSAPNLSGQDGRVCIDPDC
jgi:hypothetical protein